MNPHNKSTEPAFSQNEVLRRQAEETRSENESRFRYLLQDVPNIAVQGYSLDGTTQYWNRASEHLYGYSAQEAIGRNLLDLIIPPEMREDVHLAIKQMAETGEAIPASELWLMRKDGSRVAVFSSHVIVQVPGRGQELFCLDVDLTERKKVESALLENEAILRLITDHIPAVVAYVDARDLRYQFTNRVYAEMFGWTPEKMIGRHVSEIMGEEAYARALPYIERARGGEPMSFDNVVPAKGKPHWFNIRYVPRFDQQGMVQNIVVMAIDITERKRAEEALRQSENRLCEILNSLDGLVYVADMETHEILFINKYGKEIWGDNVGYRCWQSFQAGQQGPCSFCTNKRLLNSDGTPTGVYVWENQDTVSQRWYERRDSAILWPDGRTVRLETATDITERKRAEEALKKSEALYHALVETSQDLIWQCDVEGRYIYLNSAWEKAFGYRLHEMLGKPFSTFQSPEMAARDQKEFARLLQGGSVKGFETVHIGKSGQEIHLVFNAMFLTDENGTVYGTRGTAYDITERKKAEAEKEKLQIQNRHLQKSESLGRMAGAIAHHFNNQLQSVMTNLELAMTSLPGNAEAAENLARAMESAHKAAEVSTQMLTYLGQTHGRREALDLADVCRGSLPLLQAGMPKIMTLETNLPSPGPVIDSNLNHIQQILTNLFTNAVEANADRNGFIQLSVKTVPNESIPAKHRFPMEWSPHTNDYACLEMVDGGCGISEDDFQKVFDPFFTRKFVGRGLGLPVILGIVRAHQGVITVESTIGQGTVFRVFLPLSAKAVVRKPHPITATPSAPSGRTVLVIDDDAAVRKALVTALGKLNFTTLAAADGVEGVELFGRNKDKISCVLCDLTMPRMNGWETLEALRKLDPNIPVILSSGYSESRVMEGRLSELPQALLSKPYEFKELGQVIARVIKGNG